MDAPTRQPEMQQASADKAKSTRRGWLLTLLFFLVIVGVAGYGAYWVLYGSHFVSTDNAYVGAESAEVTPLVSAPVSRVLVQDTQAVNAGDILVELDASDAQLAVDQAQADMAGAQSNLTRTRIDLSRRQALAPSGAVSADELSSARDAFAAAQATQASAQARFNAAQLALTRMTIRAPIAGIVSHRNVQVGQRVEAGVPLMIIAPIGQAYVDANFKEIQLQHVAIGQPVTLHADLYGDSVTYHGVVAGVGGGTGAAFSLIPAQNASGNWIKVVQRVPVRIRLDPRELAAHPLRIGLSMTASIDISGAPHG